jgi:hypothetical protein
MLRAQPQQALLVTVRRVEAQEGWAGLEDRHDAFRQASQGERVPALRQAYQMVIVLIVLVKHAADECCVTLLAAVSLDRHTRQQLGELRQPASATP